MKKAQLPLIAELDLPDTEDSTTESNENFAGTETAGQLRVLLALLERPQQREEIDNIGDVSNGPDLIADLRQLGLEIPCRRVAGVNRRGGSVQFGVYSLTKADSGKLQRWLRKLKRDHAASNGVAP